MKKDLQRMLNIFQMEMNNIRADTQSLLMEIRIIRRNLDRWERRRDEERMRMTSEDGSHEEDKKSEE